MILLIWPRPNRLRDQSRALGLFHHLEGGLEAGGLRHYKPRHDTNDCDHHANYIPGALIQKRRRAEVFELLAPPP